MFLVAFTGMRGAVSLAAALAIPRTLDSGAPFPDRDLVLFLVYAVILGTLLIEGLSLPAIIERLGLGGDSDEDRERARGSSPRRRRSGAWTSSSGSTGCATRPPDACAASTSSACGASPRGWTTRTTGASRRAHRPTSGCAARRWRPSAAELLRLRRAGEISEETMRRVERDLDLEDARLEI